MKAINNLGIETLKNLAKDFYEKNVRKIEQLILILNEQKKDKKYHCALTEIGERNEELKKYGLGIESIIKENYFDAQKGKLNKKTFKENICKLLE